MRPTRLSLSGAALVHNAKRLRQLAPHSQLLGMIKANAYGHGLRQVGLRLQAHVDCLGVASLDEAIALRQAGVTCPLTLIEGVFAADELPQAAALGCAIVVHSFLQLDWLELALLPQQLSIWIKVDTGMGRLGFQPHELDAVRTRLHGCANIAGHPGLLSHLAASEDPQAAVTQRQVACFRKLAATWDGPHSLCNSGGIFTLPDLQADCVRPGLALYGVSPLPGKTGVDLGLQPVMRLASELIAVKHLRAGATVGYGATFTCPEDMPVGIAALGYGDGYLRSTDPLPIIVGGVPTTTLGLVSMDLLAVDLRPVPQARIGDSVIAWGRDGSQCLPVEQVAAAAGRSPYELLTGVQIRVKSVWID